MPAMRRLYRLLRWSAAVLVILFAAGCAILRLPAFGGDPDPAAYGASPQVSGERFENVPPQEALTLGKLRTMIGNYLGGQERAPRGSVPVVPWSPGATTPPGLRLTWFGHASVLIEIDGLRLMTDPVFGERVSPFAFVGPRRFHAPPRALEEMPRVDAVLISHDHYDHLEMATVRHFAAQGTHFHVGLGIGAHLARWGVPAAQIHELDWWRSETLASLTIHSTPARHYSGRRAADNSTLWSAWFVRGRDGAVYYSGDTGYTAHFAETRRRLGAPDVAIVKVGAYGETWLDIHMDPESAVRAAADLGAQVLLPVHWATFNLAYHAWAEPIERTLAAATAAGVTVTTPTIGETYIHGTAPPRAAWWEPAR
jgi:L-ascorbate metabolism protein UlaG (beta-lactamase superfamily)